MQYFFQYVLGFRGNTNKKALMGTIVHRVMQVLADKKIAQSNNEELLVNDDIQNLEFDECDDTDFVTELCFQYYDSHEPEVGLDESDLKTCKKWVKKAIAYNDGMYDPRNQEVHVTEHFFDIEIKKPWAKFSYDVDGKKIEGYLSIKGTVDLIIKEDTAYFQVLDYKTGKRLNWATGKEKTQEDLQKDVQLLLYYYALKNLHPDWEFYVSIYYINDGGVFDVVFSEDDYIKAENILKQKFEYIRSVKQPKQLSHDQTHWKCQRLCKFSEIHEESGKSVCNHFHDMVKSKGIDKVTADYANLDKLTKYGSGGGRIAEDEKRD